MVDDDVSINYDFIFDEVGDDDDVHVDEYFSTEEVRRACLLSPVSNACPDLREISNALLSQHFVMNPVLHNVCFLF